MLLSSCRGQETDILAGLHGNFAVETRHGQVPIILQAFSDVVAEMDVTVGEWNSDIRIIALGYAR